MYLYCYSCRRRISQNEVSLIVPSISDSMGNTLMSYKLIICKRCMRKLKEDAESRNR